MTGSAAQRGLGLIELMIALVLGLVLVLGVVQIFLASKQSYALQQHQSAIQENARYLLSRISTELRQAGLFGCLDLERLPASVRSQVPDEFATPITYADGQLRILTALSPVSRTAGTGPLSTDSSVSAAEFGARWVLVSDCLNELRVGTGSSALSLAPGDTVIPVRQLEYELRDNAIRVRTNGVGSPQVLIDGVAEFSVEFGLAAAPLDANVSDSYVTSVAGQESRIRSVRLALGLSDNPGDAEQAQVRTQRFAVVTTLRGRQP
ncbi:MAG: PilW family protein [Pseudomonas sp.]